MAGGDDWVETTPSQTVPLRTEGNGGADDWVETTPAEREGPSVADSALAGAKQGATFGFADELGGALQAGANAIAGAAPKLVQAYQDFTANHPLLAAAAHLPQTDIETRYSGSLDDSGDVYRGARDQNRVETAQAAQANPAAFVGGSIAGGLLTAKGVPTFTPFNSLTGSGRIANAAVNGFGQGALAGLGGSAADLTRGEIGAATGDTLLGGSVGGTLSAGITSGVEAAQPIADAVKRFANRRAVDAAGMMLKDYRLLENQMPGKVDEVGDYLLQNGGVRFGDSTPNVAERLTQMRNTAGNRVGAAIDALDRSSPNGAGISGQQLADMMERQVLRPLQRFPAQRDVAARVADEIQQVRALGNRPVSFDYLEGLKRSYDPAARFGSVPSVGNEMVGAFRDLRGVAMNATEQAAGRVSSPAAGAFDAAKREYGLLAPAEDAATDKTLRLMANRQISPSSYLAGAAGMTGQDGSTLKGLAFALGNKLLLDRGSSSAAVTANLTSKALAAAGRAGQKYAAAFSAAAARSPAAVAALDFVLTQRDPQYREAKAQGDGENR